MLTGKPFYTDYVRHALRFYARHGAELGGTPTFRREVDRLNWTACDAAVRSLSDEEKRTVLRVFGADGNELERSVTTIAQERGVTVNALWALVRGVERLVAVHRGLI